MEAEPGRLAPVRLPRASQPPRVVRSSPSAARAAPPAATLPIADIRTVPPHGRYAAPSHDGPRSPPGAAVDARDNQRQGKRRSLADRELSFGGNTAADRGDPSKKRRRRPMARSLTMNNVVGFRRLTNVAVIEGGSELKPSDKFMGQNSFRHSPARPPRAAKPARTAASLIRGANRGFVKSRICR